MVFYIISKSKNSNLNGKKKNKNLGLEPQKGIYLYRISCRKITYVLGIDLRSYLAVWFSIVQRWYTREINTSSSGISRVHCRWSRWRWWKKYRWRAKWVRWHSIPSPHPSSLQGLSFHLQWLEPMFLPLLKAVRHCRFLEKVLRTWPLIVGKGLRLHWSSKI